MLKISRISTKLGLVYAGLFAAMMITISVITYAVVTNRAMSIVSDEIVASSQVFSHLFVDRGEDIRSDTELQVRDFGFRSAITSDDLPTINSALETLRQRLQVDGLAWVDPDGLQLGGVGTYMPLSELSEQMAETAYEDVQPAPGVVFMNGQSMLSGYVPVRAPNLIGFVVFSDLITSADIAEIVELSPIPLQVRIEPLSADAGLTGLVERTEADMLYRHEVPSLLRDKPAVLVLTYPLNIAFAPYRVLLFTLVFISIIGTLLITAASWWIAQRLARPVAALAAAADKVRQGSEAQVSLQTGDELQDLATAFNHMSSEVRQREIEIKRRARLDLETMLPNRLAFEEALQNAAEVSEQFVVLAIGIERFSEIRGAIGFDASSDLLVEVYHRIQTHPQVKAVALITAGVFGAHLNLAQSGDVKQAVQTLRESLNKTFSIREITIDIITTMGVNPVANGAPAIALKQAMIALDQAYSAKTWQAVYDDQKYLQTSTNLSLMGDLLQAMEAQHVYVEYQPKFDLRSGEVIGVEALVRWHDPVRGKIYPDAFIPLAEETGHIENLTLYVLAHSIQAQKQILRHGFDLILSINVSGRLVGNTGFSEKAMSYVQDAAGKLCFEITETAVMENPDAAMAALDVFTEAEIEISIDDYGSGLSSLAYLKQLPASELKIDKAFVLQIDQSKRDAMLVQSTVNLAHSLGMKVTAEGIETATAQSLLASMGCDIGQGYHLARPMPIERLIGFLKTQRQAHNQLSQDSATVNHAS